MKKVLEAIYSGEPKEIEEQVGRIRDLEETVKLLESAGKVRRCLGKVLKKKCYFLEQISPLVFIITIKDVRIAYFCNQIDIIKYKGRAYKIYVTTEEYIGPKVKYYFKCIVK